MSSTNHSSRGSIVGLVFATLSLLLAALLFFNRQYVLDQITFWQYEPTSQIRELAKSSGMNGAGEFYFYASRPTLEGTQQFNQECDRKEERTAILGCYTGQRIYIYDVQDERLDGIRAVTAAHEMLHAAYERMGEAERQRIDGLLEKEYEKLKNDAKLAERMEFYARTEPGQRGNELHSVIGTEITDIGPELDQYYKKYFADRSKVVALHANYEKVFKTLQARADALSAELRTLRDTIETDTVIYNKDLKDFNSDAAEFKKRANGGDFDSRAQFDRELAVLTSRAGQLDEFREEIEANIARYQSLQKDLTGVASQSEELNRSINSNLAPAPTPAI